MGPCADHEVLGDLDAARDQAIDFLQQAERVDDHAGRHDALHVRPENAAGNQRELERLPVHHHSMPGVGPALVADHDIVAVGKEIDDLPLGFITPLQSNDTRSRHDLLSI